MSWHIFYLSTPDDSYHYVGGPFHSREEAVKAAKRYVAPMDNELRLCTNYSNGHYCYRCGGIHLKVMTDSAIQHSDPNAYKLPDGLPSLRRR